MPQAAFAATAYRVVAPRRRRGTFRRPAPLPGEHTTEVLAELGLERAAIERRGATKVVARA